jgi:hypothetical protein
MVLVRLSMSGYARLSYHPARKGYAGRNRRSAAHLPRSSRAGREAHRALPFCQRCWGRPAHQAGFEFDGERIDPAKSFDRQFRQVHVAIPSIAAFLYSPARTAPIVRNCCCTATHSPLCMSRLKSKKTIRTTDLQILPRSGLTFFLRKRSKSGS